MPRSFDLTAEYLGTVEQVHSAFSDEEYWLSRLADSGADIATLDSMTVGDDGAVTVATTQALRTDRLPAMVTQFHPRELEIVRSESWGPIDDGVARAEVAGAVTGAPVALSGAAVLEPTDTGSRLKFTATVEVPKIISGLTIQNLDLTFNTGTKAFHFGTLIMLPLDNDIRLDLTVSIDVTQIDVTDKDSGYEATFGSAWGAGEGGFGAAAGGAPPEASTRSYSARRVSSDRIR